MSYKEGFFERVKDRLLQQSNSKEYNTPELPEELSPFEKYTRSLSQEIFEKVFTIIEEILVETDEAEDVQAAFNKIQQEQEEKIIPHLTKWMINGGSRANDRPWWLEKSVEETRQRLLAALIKSITPQFRNSNLDWEAYKEKYIDPLFDKFSLPVKCIMIADPKLSKVRK